MSYRIAIGVLAVLLWASPGLSQQGAPAGQWPAYGGDHASTTYAPLDQIDAANVERL